MKFLIGFLVLVCISTKTIYLAIKKKTDNKLTCILLGFAIVSSIAVVNYDKIKKLSLGGMELEFAELKK